MIAGGSRGMGAGAVRALAGKLIAVFASVALAASVCLPTAAFAAQDASTTLVAATAGLTAESLTAQDVATYDNAFTFTDDAITATGEGTGYTIDGTTLTITVAGSYLLSGSCANGQVVVNKKVDADLYFANSFSLTNTAAAPLECGKSSDVLVYALGTATFSDASTGDAGLKAKGGATLTVSGAEGSTLNVSSAVKNGIKGGAGAAVVIGQSSGDGFTLNVTASAKSGIASDGTITMNGGNVSITATDGIKSAPEADSSDDGESKGNITINGGDINIVASDDGIAAKPDAGNTVATGAITVNGGTVSISAGADAIKADYEGTGTAATSNVVVNGGSITVASAGDEGMQVAGALTVAEGAFDITSTSDAIRAEGDIAISNGTFHITSSSDGIQSGADLAIAGGTFDITTCGGYNSTSFDGNTSSAKGIKCNFDEEDESADTSSATNTLTITGGDFTLNTADDAIHSDAYAVVTGGEFAIQTGDDAVHADTSLTLGEENAANCKVHMDIDNCYEGLESGSLYIYSGSYDIVASDDGLNAAGGGDGSGQQGPGTGGDNFNPGGQPGGPGGSGGFRPFSTATAQSDATAQDTSSYTMGIYGGAIRVEAGGDGFDSNGALNIAGGTVVSFSNGNSDNAYDADGAFTISGGTVFGVGGNSPAAPAISTTSGQYKKTWTALTSSIASGRTIVVTAGGSTVVSIAAPFALSTSKYWMYSSPSSSASSAKISSTTSAAAGTPSTWISHSWNSPTWSWASDYSSATATFVCANCGETVTKDAAVTSSTKSGTQYYTASVELDGTTYSDTQGSGESGESDESGESGSTAKNISDYVATLSGTTFAYTGSSIRPAVTIVGLAQGTDCTVSYANNVNVGTATVSITGMGSYEGTMTKTFKITAVKLSSASLKSTMLAYTGKARTPAVVVKAKVGGKTVTLTKGADYTVSYANNVKCGKATVTVTGKGNFTGTLTKTFVVKPAKVTGLKVVSKKAGKITVKWSKAKAVAAGATGYQIYYKVAGKSAKTVLMKRASAASKVISKLAKGNKTVVKVRAYKTVSGKRYYGAWSATKKVSVKS